MRLKKAMVNIAPENASHDTLAIVEYMNSAAV
jgi:hypothetical protein